MKAKLTANIRSQLHEISNLSACIQADIYNLKAQSDWSEKDREQFGHMISHFAANDRQLVAFLRFIGDGGRDGHGN
jgi:hypothetical protein